MNSLTAEEARILGCLIEKEATTPEYYPLTVNSLVAASNQKTNRDPVVDYDSMIVERTLLSLDEKGLIGLTRASGGRATKYVHRAGDFLEVDSEQLAVLAVLLLRGPQTPGELRSRTERYFVAEKPLEVIEEILNDLMTRSEPLVERLPRKPGQKENRFRCLMADTPTREAPAEILSPDSLTDRVERLERHIRILADSLGIELDIPGLDPLSDDDD